jgi:UDP-glucose 4-epimerase
MRILVTGGAGFIGSNLVEELVKEHNVIVIDNLHTGSLDNLKNVRDQITIINDSCNNLFRLTIPDVDIIFHFGIPSSSPMYRKDPFLMSDAINGTINLFEYAKDSSVQKVIFASSSSLYSGIRPPHREDMNIRVTDYYTEARFAIERIAKLYNVLHGIKSAGLRFFSVYGPHEEAKGTYANIITQFIWEMRKNRTPVIYGDGKQTRDFTYVKDIIQACKLMIDTDFNYDIYNVGTGRSHSFNDVVDILNDRLETSMQPVYIEMPIKNYVSHTLADIYKIKSLGYNPDYTLIDGIDQLVSQMTNITNEGENK